VLASGAVPSAQPSTEPVEARQAPCSRGRAQREKLDVPLPCFMSSQHSESPRHKDNTHRGSTAPPYPVPGRWVKAPRGVPTEVHQGWHRVCAPLACRSHKGELGALQTKTVRRGEPPSALSVGQCTQPFHSTELASSRPWTRATGPIHWREVFSLP
jgi:hypothetical protein